MKLKLEVRSNDGRTVYPDGGPLLNIQKALARAQGMQSPCAQLTELHSMAQADCAAELISTFESPSWSMRLQQWRWALQNSLAVALKPLGIPLDQQSTKADATSLLLTAAAHEATQTIPALIRKGAQANASDPDQPGRTAMGYVACQNNVALLESMLAAGARADASLHNDKGQVITPLTQALRCDAAEAIDRLLKAGASLNTQDPTGWTPMHIAAYESAARSIPVMVQHGGNVNEKTPAYRQQTALHTALQFAGIPTIEAMLQAGGDLAITDNQQKNACEWARFFKRGPAIEQLVCQQAQNNLDGTISR
jgi:ankyrin repeat protein